jgi:hypothetical protein
MSTPNYTIEYCGDRICAIEFTPHFCSSDGHTNGILAKALIDVFCIPGWSLTTTGAMRHILSNHDTNHLTVEDARLLVELAQASIESLMNEALKLNKFLTAIKESQEEAGGV